MVFLCCVQIRLGLEWIVYKDKRFKGEIALNISASKILHKSNTSAKQV